MTIPPNDNVKNPQPDPAVRTPLATEVQEKPLSNRKRSQYLILFTLILGVIGIIWFLLWFFIFQFHVSTDDAYANGNMININPAIPGSVIAFYADDTDFVEEGQLLVQLDRTYYEVAYQKALAELAAQTLQIQQLSDQVQANLAQVKINQIAYAKARYDTDNRAQLVGSLAISNEEFTHSKDDLSTAENLLKQAQYNLAASQALLGNSPIDQHPLILEKKDAVLQAYVDLKHCDIYAPSTGYVALRAVNVGESVSRNSNLMAIIPKDHVWVDANFKETELTSMRVGQPATVWFDLYGSDIKFEGKVLGIASGTGSIFSLIPPQNATGNWIKIVQRLPVRISLDPELTKKYPIRLGISAEVNVNIADQDLPRMTQPMQPRAVSKTPVFDINMEEINAFVKKIINSNLTPVAKE